VVEPGDHLWAIATQVVTEVHGHPVSDAVVADYWCELVEINRPRLVDPANPDLIYPGQELLVPAPPARS
jgi:nucleoid-associated protein YgaU